MRKGVPFFIQVRQGVSFYLQLQRGSIITTVEMVSGARGSEFFKGSLDVSGEI